MKNWKQTQCTVGAADVGQARPSYRLTVARAPAAMWHVAIGLWLFGSRFAKMSK